MPWAKAAAKVKSQIIYSIKFIFSLEPPLGGSQIVDKHYRWFIIPCRRLCKIPATALAEQKLKGSSLSWPNNNLAVNLFSQTV